MPAAPESDLGYADTLWKAADSLLGQEQDIHRT
jgi:hypothetical protein